MSEQTRRADPPTPAAAAEHVARPVPHRSLPVALVVAARPKQWAKNLLVFAAPFAAGLLDNVDDVLRATLAFVAFCLAASGTYYLNDAADVDADRSHPKKRYRPIAAGQVPVPLARVLGVLYSLAAIAIALSVTWQLAVVLVAYALLTFTYTVWLKHQPILDVVGVAAGFVLRAIAGGAAIGVTISDWFFIITTFGSLLIVIGKRHAESLEMGEHRGTTRSTLAVYSRSYLAYLLSVSSGVVLVAYCLWAFERAALSDASPVLYQISIVPFGVGVLRYAFLIDQGQGGAPEDLILHDRWMLGVGALWGACFALAIYL